MVAHQLTFWGELQKQHCCTECLPSAQLWKQCEGTASLNIQRKALIRQCLRNSCILWSKPDPEQCKIHDYTFTAEVCLDEVKQPNCTSPWTFFLPRAPIQTKKSYWQELLTILNSTPITPIPPNLTRAWQLVVMSNNEAEPWEIVQRKCTHTLWNAHYQYLFMYTIGHACENTTSFTCCGTNLETYECGNINYLPP